MMVEDFNSEHVKNWIQNTFVIDKQDWSQLTSVTAYPLWSNETNMEVIFSTLKSTVLLLNAFKVGSFTINSWRFVSNRDIKVNNGVFDGVLRKTNPIFVFAFFMTYGPTTSYA